MPTSFPWKLLTMLHVLTPMKPVLFHQSSNLHASSLRQLKKIYIYFFFIKRSCPCLRKPVLFKAGELLIIYSGDKYSAVTSLIWVCVTIQVFHPAPQCELTLPVGVVKLLQSQLALLIGHS